jgi:alanyl-tRNA synthetase
VISETGVAAGVRRIEALTGLAAFAYVTEVESTLMQASRLAKSAPTDLPARLEALLAERKTLERQVIDLRRQLALLDTKDHGGSKDQAEDVREVGGIKLITRHLNDVPTKDLKPLVDDLKAKVGSGVVVVTSIVEGKTSLVIGVTQDLTGRLSAVDLVRAGAAILGGNGGGGRSDLAQAGGSNSNVSEAVKAIEDLMQNR